MAVLRGTIPADEFTIISNAWLRDARLSWRAKGLLVYIASHAPGYRLTMEQMITEGTDQRDAVRSTLKELETAGYLVRTRIHDKITGQMGSYDFELTAPSAPPVQTQDGETHSGKGRTGYDQGEHDVSAGHAQSGLPTAGETPTKKITSKNTRENQDHTKGTRLPEDFQPNEKMRAWFVGEQLGQYIDGRTEHEKFVNHFLAASGQRGIKRVWSRAWMNWMREAAERSQGRGRYQRPGAPARRSAYQTSTEKHAARNQREAGVSKIFDRIAEEEGTPRDDWEAVQDVSRRANVIFDQLQVNGQIDVTTCQPPGYTTDRNIVDAEWTEDPKLVKEVTAGAT